MRERFTLGDNARDASPYVALPVGGAQSAAQKTVSLNTVSRHHGGPYRAHLKPLNTIECALMVRWEPQKGTQETIVSRTAEDFYGDFSL